MRISKKLCWGLVLAAVSGLPQSVTVKPLTESAKQAQDLANNWSEGDGSSPISIDKLGRVRYVYGAEMPTVLCSVLRICAIELEAGENVVGDLQIGDTERWSVSLVSYGGLTGAKTPVIAISPTAKGAFETNLIIATDRRMYYIRLQNKPEDYMARVSFSYPEDAAAKRKREMEAIAPAPTVEPAVVLPPPTQNPDDLIDQALSKLNMDYTLTGGKKTPCLKPSKVFDDKVHTYIQMPACVDARSLPVLLVYGDGGEVQTNYRYDPQYRMFKVDQLFQKAKLQAGTSKEAKKNAVLIARVKAEGSK